MKSVPFLCFFRKLSVSEVGINQCFVQLGLLWKVSF